MLAQSQHLTFLIGTTSRISQRWLKASTARPARLCSTPATSMLSLVGRPSGNSMTAFRTLLTLLWSWTAPNSTPPRALPTRPPSLVATVRGLPHRTPPTAWCRRPTSRTLRVRRQVSSRGSGSRRALRHRSQTRKASSGSVGSFTSARVTPCLRSRTTRRSSSCPLRTPNGRAQVNSDDWGDHRRVQSGRKPTQQRRGGCNPPRVDQGAGQRYARRDAACRVDARRCGVRRRIRWAYSEHVRQGGYVVRARDLHVHRHSARHRRHCCVG